MRILLVALEAPFGPSNGLRLPLGHLWRHLEQHMDVRLVAYRLPDQPGTPPPGMRLLQRPARSAAATAVGLTAATFRGEPLNARRYADGLRRAVAEELAYAPPDVVHVFSGRLALLGRSLGEVPAILTALDAWHLNVEARARQAAGVRARLLAAECARVRRFEAHTYPLFDRVVTVTDADAAALTEPAPGLSTVVIPNGVDADRFSHAAADPVPERIVLHGAMGYAPNVDAARHLVRDVLPAVRRRRPAAHVVLVGRGPAREVRTLASRHVTVTGEVDDVVPWLHSASVYCCPMRTGTGIKNKLLEAMAAGRACVATPLATQGMAVRDGIELLIASDPGDVADRVVGLLGDPAARDALGAAAAAYVRGHHSWAGACRAYEAVYDEVAGA